MSAPDLAMPSASPRRTDVQRWRARSRFIRLLRVALPAVIVLIFAGLIASIAYNTLRAVPVLVDDKEEPIRLVNPRFVGRDDRGRAFVLTAATATRDPEDYQRVVLDRPALVLDENGPDQMRVSGVHGVYHEANRKLQLTGGVRLSGAEMTFETAASLFDTKTGELVGSGPIQGFGGIGEINAKSYSITEKGDRIVLGGGVRARIDTK